MKLRADLMSSGSSMFARCKTTEPTFGMEKSSARTIKDQRHATQLLATFDLVKLDRGPLGGCGLITRRPIVSVTV